MQWHAPQEVGEEAPDVSVGSSHSQFLFFVFCFESTQLARQLHQERTQMEVQY